MLVNMQYIHTVIKRKMLHLVFLKAFRIIVSVCLPDLLVTSSAVLSSFVGENSLIWK